MSTEVGRPPAPAAVQISAAQSRAAQGRAARRPAFPPALAHATAPAPRPARLVGAALVLHLAAFGLLFAVLHKHRPPPLTAPPSIALIMQKSPPRPAPQAKPPAPPAPAAAIPQPPPPPPPRHAPAKPPPAAPKLAAARAPPASAPPVVPQLTRAPSPQSWVLLNVQIGPDGAPQAATIAESSGSALMDNRARATVLRRWHFQPAIRAGQPIASMVQLWVSFGLSN